MEFFASGKLLLFGEYLVLKGADSFAFPLRFGQTLKVKNSAEDFIKWESKEKDKLWFSAIFSKDLEIISTTDENKAKIIIQLLSYINSKNVMLFATGLELKTQTDFPMEWGFGTSSSLISLLSQWSGVDPFELLEISFGGSGYDIACATADSPLLYNATSKKTTPVHLSDKITDYLLFIYSGQKQSSAKEIQQFDLLKIEKSQIEMMTNIVLLAAEATKIERFENAMEESEALLGKILNAPLIKNKYFSDYPFEIKSLGAWGGDFFMASFRDEKEAKNYFQEKGFHTQFNYKELIKK